MTVLLRVAALVVAIGLVLVGLAVRDRGGVPDDPFDAASGDDVAVEAAAFACSDDLGELCLALARAAGSDLEVDAADRLAKRLVADERLVWLAPRAWADLVDDARGRAGSPPLARAGTAMASTPLLLVGWQERLAVLADACGVPVDALGWDCVGQQAGREWAGLGGDLRWGRVRPGHAPPDTGLGLADTAAVLAGRAGLGFTLTDLRDPATATWFADLERAVVDHTPAQGRHLAAMVVQGPAVADVAVATGAEVAAFAGRDPSFGPLAVVTPDPLVVVELVVVGTYDDAVAQAAGLLGLDAAAAVLEQAGWTVGPAADGEPAVTSGGALTAMRAAWADAAG